MSAASGRLPRERVLAAAVVLLAGCAVPASPPADGAPTAPGTASEPLREPELSAAPPPSPSLGAPLSAPLNVEGYRVHIAQRILDANSGHTFEGALPRVLKSVIVLQVTLDREGRLTGTELFRSNGYKALEATAHRSARSAAPFAPPPRDALRGGVFRFTETWLFRDDGKFQIRSLAGPQ